LTLRVLLLADTHLGLDFPLRPRVERRRRGPDFFANTRSALAAARRGDVDLVVHGGDLLFRSKVPAELVRPALEPLLEVADAGVPVVLVPGNHERSALPFPLLAAHSHLHVFDQPRTIGLDVAGCRVALAGFPCQRNAIRSSFNDLVSATQWQAHESDLSLLCLHQTVEGAVVGTQNYVFRSGSDIIRGRDLPSGFAAVLAGHIHRHQVLTHDLDRRELATPVFYPGSVERTSAAERDETKGSLIIDLEPDRRTGGRVINWGFHKLPARPMVDLELDDSVGESAENWLRANLRTIDPDAVIRIRVTETPDQEMCGALKAASLRRLALPTQTVEVSWPRKLDRKS
jgi:exonuclease SbcD